MKRSHGRLDKAIAILENETWERRELHKKK